MLFAVLLASPAIGSGLLADDVGQRAFILTKLAGHSEQPWWDMFVLVGATPEELDRMRYLGSLPWWISTEVRIAFWRPLTAATHYLDYALWPEQPALMHLHQLLWHGLACGLAWGLFRRLSSSHAAAGAGALAFSLTHLHLSASAWLAHRNAVLVLVFTLAALLAHDRWRREGWRTGALLGPASFLAALLCGEMGVAALGFIVAHALLVERGPLTQRFVAVAPYLVALIIWRLAFDWLGYGAWGSGIYIDPVVEPLRWIVAFPERMMELLIYAVGPPTRHRGVGAAAVLTVSLGVAWTLSRQDEARGPLRVLAFAACGLVLSLVPLTTTAPHDRVLVLATIGTCLAFGELIDAALRSSRLPLWLCGGLIVAIHCISSPIAALRFAAKVEDFKVSAAVYPAASALDDRLLRRQSVVIMHSPNLLYATLLAASREARGLNRPNFSWVLHAEGEASVCVRRIDRQTFELEDELGWARGPETALMRATRSAPFMVGERVRTLDFELEVLEVDEGRPTHVRVKLRAALDDPSFVVVSWGGEDFVRWEGEMLSCAAG